MVETTDDSKVGQTVGPMVALWAVCWDVTKACSMAEHSDISTAVTWVD